MKDSEELTHEPGGMTFGRAAEISEAISSGEELELSPEEKAQYERYNQISRRLGEAISKSFTTSAGPAMRAMSEAMSDMSPSLGDRLTDQLNTQKLTQPAFVVPELDTSWMDAKVKRDNAERDRSIIQTEALIWLKENGERQAKEDADRKKSQFWMNFTIIVIAALTLVATIVGVFITIIK